MNFMNKIKWQLSRADGILPHSLMSRSDFAWLNCFKSEYFSACLTDYVFLLKLTWANFRSKKDNQSTFKRMILTPEQYHYVRVLKKPGKKLPLNVHANYLPLGSHYNPKMPVQWRKPYNLFFPVFFSFSFIPNPISWSNKIQDYSWLLVTRTGSFPAIFYSPIIWWNII